jgi:predicted DNA-binding protein with PD1-like motif
VVNSDKYQKGDTMLDNIKNFVKSVSSTTWLVIAVGVFAAIVLTWVSSHTKAPEATPAAEKAPATK